MQLWRIGLAIVLAPATGPLVYGLGMLLGSGYPYSGPGHMEKHLLSILWLMALSYPVSLGLGVPIVASLYFSRTLTGLNCIAWALVAGAAAGIAFYLVTIPAGYETALWQIAFLCAGFAALAGLTAFVFCLIAGLRMRKSPVSA